MLTKSPLLSGIIVLSCLSACTVGHRITPLPEHVQPGDQAAYYALPRTVVTATFPVSKAEIKKGSGEHLGTSCFDRLGEDDAFAGGSMKLWQAIGLEEPPKLGASYRVTGKPTIGSLAEPDPDQVFRVDLGSSWAIKRSVNLAYGPLGVLESGTSFVQDRRVDLSVAFLKAASKLFTVMDLRGSFPFSVPEEVSLDDCDLQAPDTCQKIACEIYVARQDLRKLPTLVGGGLEGDQAAWLEKRYGQDIDKRLPVFLRQTSAKASVVCAVRPTTNVNPGESSSQFFSLLDHSTDQGFFAVTGADCLIPNGFQEPPIGTTWTRYDLAVGYSPDQLVGKLGAAGVPTAHNTAVDQGFYYRVPATSRVEVKKGPEALAEDELIVAQLGFVAALPRQSTYQTKYKVTLDPNTGALKTLDAESDSVDPALITGAGDAVAGVLEARQKEREAEAAASDELALLERERKILEEQIKIREAREKLGEEPPL